MDKDTSGRKANLLFDESKSHHANKFRNQIGTDQLRKTIAYESENDVADT